MRKRFELITMLERTKRIDLQRAARGTPPARVIEAARNAKSVSEMAAKWTGNLENVYRVLIGDPIEVVCMGIDSVDKEAEGTYGSTSDLPTWMQEKLAVLSMMKVDPPQTKIEGVGMRVDEQVFWVVKGEGT